MDSKTHTACDIKSIQINQTIYHYLSFTYHLIFHIHFVLFFILVNNKIEKANRWMKIDDHFVHYSLDDNRRVNVGVTRFRKTFIYIKELILSTVINVDWFDGRAGKHVIVRDKENLEKWTFETYEYK